MKLKELKKGQYFTKRWIEEPTDDQVWIRGDFDRSTGKYECQRFSDISCFCLLTGTREVYTDFTF